MQRHECKLKTSAAANNCHFHISHATLLFAINSKMRSVFMNAKGKKLLESGKNCEKKKNYYSKLSPMMKSLLMAENQFIAVLMQRSKTLVLMHILRL